MNVDRFWKKVGLIALALVFLIACTPAAEPKDTEPAPATDASPPATELPATQAPATAGQAHTGEDDKRLDRPEGDFPLSEAVKLFAEKYPNAPLTQIEREREDGVFVYKIEGQEGDLEHKMKVHAHNGTILKTETDDDDDDVDNFFQYADAIPVQQAFDKARQALEGEWVLETWELDKDDGVLEYEFEFERPNGDDDVDVHIDATTGEVREIDD